MDTPRDPDIADVFLHADQVVPVGVQVLLNRLQSYRDIVREVADFVDAQAVQSNGTTSVYRLKDHIAAINARLMNLQWQLDLDHVALADLTDGCQFDGSGDG